MVRRVRPDAAAAFGMLLVGALWHLLPGWNLSEETASGEIIPGGGDDLAPQIGSVLVLVTLLTVVVAAAGRWNRREAVAVQVSVAGVWVALWAWRVSVARTSGANLWPVGLILVVLPAAAISIVGIAVVHRVINSRTI